VVKITAMTDLKNFKKTWGTHMKGQLESEIPQFTVATYLKSVTEDSQTARTATKGKNE